MNQNILISIIVPIYNIEQYLPKCIESIMEQTYNHIEIILVDDGSTDNSPKICDRYANLDSRIHVIHKPNGGLIHARKSGVCCATGEYVLFVDGDDWIEKKRIQNLADAIASSNAQMIYLSGLYRDSKDSSRLAKEEIPFRTYENEEICSDLFPLFSDTSKCFLPYIHWFLVMWSIRLDLLKNAYQDIPNEIVMGEDMACVWTCLLNSNKVISIYEPGYHYVRREDSISHSGHHLSLESFHHWYHYLKTILDKHNVSARIWQMFKFSAVCILIQSNYNILLDSNHECLYPFAKILPHSRIVIYGAGDYGCQLVRALKDNNNYEIVGWIDKSKAGSNLMGHTILGVEDLRHLDYDYIAIMIMDANTSETVEQTLLQMGIEQQKIALMDPTLVGNFRYHAEG